MAHFLTLVLIDPDQPALMDAADASMRAYFTPDFVNLRCTKCDGFVVGGRFDGDIWGKEQNYNLSPAEFQDRYGFDKIRAEDNVRPVSQLRSDLLPFAVITPDGQWQDCEGKSEQQWETEWSALRHEYAGHVAVAFDCHC